jgi:hypothetical protein
MSNVDQAHFPRVSVHEVLRILVAFDDDPHSPNGCFTLIVSCTTVCATLEVDLPPKLLSHFVRFPTVHRTSKDVEALMQRLFTCRWATAPPPISDVQHKEGPNEREQLHEVLAFMVRSVQDALTKKHCLSSLYHRTNREHL